MNLLFLVEGEKTEPKIYEDWLKLIFPHLNFVIRPEDMTGNSCRIIPGNGYPNMISSPKLYGGPSRLEACLLDIQSYDNIDHFEVAPNGRTKIKGSEALKLTGYGTFYFFFP